MYCNKCGSEIKSNASFCTKCGNRINRYFNNTSVSNEEKNSFIKIFTRNIKLKYIVGVFCMLTIFGTAYLFKDVLVKTSSFSVPSIGIKLRVVELPKDLSKFDGSKAGPIFDKNFENILNFKRKHMGNPVFVSTIKNVKVYDEPDGKELTILPKGTYCEVGDYKKVDEEEWLYLRLIQEKNDNDNFPISAWLKRTDVEIDRKNSAVFVCGKNHANRDYRHIYSIVPDENRKIVQSSGDVYLDMKSIEKIDKDTIMFTIRDNYRFYDYIYDVKHSWFYTSDTFKRIKKDLEEIKAKGDVVKDYKARYFVDENDIYYYAYGNMTPKIGEYDDFPNEYANPNYIIQTAFIKVLEGY